MRKGSRKHTDAQIIKALQKKKGLIFLAAKMLGCDPKTVYKRAKESPAVQECIDTERGKIVDTAESKLFGRIEKSDPWAVTLLLKTLGRDRGYVERQEVDQTSAVRVRFVEEIVTDGDDRDTVPPAPGAASVPAE